MNNGPLPLQWNLRSQGEKKKKRNDNAANHPARSRFAWPIETAGMTSLGEAYKVDALPSFLFDLYDHNIILAHIYFPKHLCFLSVSWVRSQLKYHEINSHRWVNPSIFWEVFWQRKKTQWGLHFANFPLSAPVPGSDLHWVQYIKKKSNSISA